MVISPSPHRFFSSLSFFFLQSIYNIKITGEITYSYSGSYQFQNCFVDFACICSQSRDWEINGFFMYCSFMNLKTKHTQTKKKKLGAKLWGKKIIKLLQECCRLRVRMPFHINFYVGANLCSSHTVSSEGTTSFQVNLLNYKV